MISSDPAKKKHFVFLDGLRGIAALMIAWMHASQIFGQSYYPSQAHLAVDFFFCLSGFVIAYAYDDKLAASMGFSDFALKRLIRLYPLIVCGVLVGGVVMLCENRVSVAQTVVTTAASLALLPIGFLFGQQAYPVNNPIWSLFFELAASAAYGVERRTARRATVLRAIVILAISGLALAAVAWSAKSIWPIGFYNFPAFVAGFARVAFPFFAGVFIFRYGLFKLRFAAPALLVACALIAVLAAPIPAVWGYDLLAIMVMLPAIVILGANATHSSALSKLWTLLGKLSYPFYILHQPIFRGLDRASELVRMPSGVVSAMPAIAILVAGAAAYLALKLYDEPIRRWLTARHATAAAAPALA